MPRRLNAVKIVRLERVPGVGPMGGAWLVSFRCPDRALFDEVVALLRALPQQDRRYLPDEHAWLLYYVDSCLTAAWQPLRDAILEWNRREDEAGYQRQDRTHTGASGAHVPAKVADACRVLCLTPDAPLGLIETARRYYAKVYHPDTGAHGDLARMQKLNAAADVAEQYARERQPGAAAGTHAA